MGSDFLRGEPNPPPAEVDLQKPYLRLHTVNIYVKDQDRSLEFYLEKLGFNLAFDTRLQSGERVVAVAPPDGTAVLRLIAPQPDSESYKLIGRPTQIAFLTEDVLAQFREWSRRGVRFPYRPRLRRIRYDEQGLRQADGILSPGAEPPVWGGVFARFEDIDGNSFTLAGLDELTQQLERQRRAIAEKLEAERRAAQEIEIAREVQARLFPQTLPPSGTLDYAGVCRQARQVGGDYYDFLNLGQERLGLVLADIAGKGIAAALLMANLQANLRSQCASAVEPRQFLESVNRLFYENTTESAYATLFFGEYEDRTGTLRYANCGHLPALLLRHDGSLERLDSTCTVVGLFRDWHCALRQCRLFPEDTLVLYSDGVTESFDDQGEQFGEQRLIQTIERHRNRPAEAFVNSVLDEVKRFSPREQHDDITLIVARCTGDNQRG